MQLLTSEYLYNHISVEFIDVENQMVFIDASNGEESIELVNHDSIETESSNEAAPVERKDIVEVAYSFY